jgi:hypothetical protein
VKSCRPLPPDVPEKEFKIFNIDGWIVIAIIVSAFLLTIFFSSMVIITSIRKRQQRIEQPTGKE